VSEAGCPFCQPRDDLVFHHGELVFALWDAFPASPGHALLVPKRHVASWFEATDGERGELITTLDVARQAVLARHSPDGFNIGVNVGPAAGQTVFHLHVHLIPRYAGDVPDPRGGVRYVIPAKANYLEPPRT
jgi:diadenosine tetraphosphate (Ap4A) HIT family hydrolase